MFKRTKEQKTEQKPGTSLMGVFFKDRRFNLSAKMILSTGLLLTSAVLIIGMLSVTLGSNAISKLSETSDMQYAKESSALISSVIDKNLSMLSEVASKKTIVTMNHDEQAQVLLEDMAKLGYDEMAVMDLSGHARNMKDKGEFDSAKQFWYEDGFKGYATISDVTISKVTNKPVVYEVAPIKRDGQVVGLLIGRREPTFLSDLVKSLGDGTRKYGFIVSADGGLMAHPNDEFVTNQTNIFAKNPENKDWFNVADALQAVTTDSAERISYNFQGDTKIGVEIPVEGTSWTLVVAQYQKDIMQPIYDLRNLLILIAFLILAIGVAVSYVISKKISAPIVKLKDVANQLAVGDIDVDLQKTSNDEVGDLTDAFVAMAANIKEQCDAAEQLAAGNLSVVITPKSDKDVLSLSLIKVVDEMTNMNNGVEGVLTAVDEGRLSHRCNVTEYNGVYKTIVQGLNDILNSFTKPIRVASAAIDQIGKGNIPKKIVKEYNGDFNTLKDSINACIDGLGALVEGNEVLSLMSVNDLSQPIKGQYLGIYSDITVSINEIHKKLEHIIDISQNIANGDMQDIEYLRTSGKQSENDTLVPSLTLMIETIEALVKETNMLADEAINGNLSARGNNKAFNGEYIKVIDGFNNTLDAVIKPVVDATDVLADLSRGKLDSRVTGDYKGQHAQIKDTLNNTMDFLSNYINEISEVLQLAGRGDLTQRITSDFVGDFVNIKAAINGINTQFGEFMLEIKQSAEQVESGSSQIASGGQVLSHGASEQASTIQELSASIEEVAQETKANAANAYKAEQLAVTASESAVEGSHKMEEMVNSMTEINQSSNEISKIIKVIDDIAFQTNILALNAAVEAARAGQHGKGFAVVAEEVRSLAARSAEAAKETTVLIETSINTVKSGTDIAHSTAESLTGIIKQVDSIVDLIKVISRASQDQSTEITEITKGIDQVAMVVQSNSATAEESAASSEELSGQAEVLKSMVSAFKLLSDGDITPVVSKPVNTTAPKTETQLIINLDDKY